MLLSALPDAYKEEHYFKGHGEIMIDKRKSNAYEILAVIWNSEW